MEKKTKPLFISTPRGDKSPFDDFWKIKRSELEAFLPLYRELRNSEDVPRSDALRPFIYLFKWAINKIKQIFWPAVLVIGVSLLCGGIMYSIYWFNKSECDRVHDLGHETDFGFFGGCYVKVNGQWMPFKIQGVNVITEGK